MSFATPLPCHLRPRREKVFGDGRPRPLDRNAKARVMTLARALMRRTEKGKAYGLITAKALAVLEALLWGFHNARSGLCFPSYEKIAERAGCARSTVAEAIKALEDAGVLTWVNRLKRVRERCQDLFGHSGSLVRVLRTSNGYRFNDPKGAAQRGFPSKSDFPSGTPIQDSFPTKPTGADDFTGMDSPLLTALHRLGSAITAKNGLAVS
jgi:DNA-binding MarR family transcriptional regulator